MGKAVGIDLGTTSSSAAVWADGKSIVIPNSHGSGITPSVVAFTKGMEILVGQEAFQQSILNPWGTVHGIKRFMGRRVQAGDSFPGLLPPFVPNEFHAVRFSIHGREMVPEVLMAFLLKRLMQDASRYLEEDVTEMVIAVPACFGDAQRQAILDAGEIAGAKVLRLINEPTAASLAHHLAGPQKPQTLLIVDLGGGYLDVSLVDVSEGICEVRSTAGDEHSGGDNFRARLLQWLADELRSEREMDVWQDPQSMTLLWEASERAKCELSHVQETEVHIPFMPHGSKKGGHFRRKVSRALLESLTEDLLGRCRKIVEDVLDHAKVSTQDLDEILLVGGGTRMPAVQQLLRELTGGGQRARLVDPGEIVVGGAAALGAVLQKDLQEVILLDVVPHSVGMEVRGGHMKTVVEKNATLPARREEIFSTVAGTDEVDVFLFEGEDHRAERNRELGRFRLKCKPSKGREPVSIGVTFDMDVNGILHVAAWDSMEKKEEPVAVERGVNLSEEEIRRLTPEVTGLGRE